MGTPQVWHLETDMTVRSLSGQVNTSQGSETTLQACEAHMAVSPPPPRPRLAWRRRQGIAQFLMLGWLQVQRMWSNSQHLPGLPCTAMRFMGAGGCAEHIAASFKTPGMVVTPPTPVYRVWAGRFLQSAELGENPDSEFRRGSTPKFRIQTLDGRFSDPCYPRG
jgi:hypothetical protein